MTHTFNTFFVAAIFAILISFLTFVAPAHAYFTTAQSAESIADGKALLFSIEYRFGQEKREVQLPILGEHSDTKRVDAVGFTVLNEAGEQMPGTATGIVLSNARITDTMMYATPKNSAKKFTLLVLFTPESTEKNEEYRLQVTNLPFNFDGTQQLQLNDSELKYYTTKLISL